MDERVVLPGNHADDLGPVSEFHDVRSPDSGPGTALEYQSLASAVSDWVARRIITGEFPAGFRLTEVELAGRVGVSRSPVREALQRLTREGLVELRPRRGAHVARLDPGDARHLYDCRILLEPHCCRLAVEAMRPEDVDELEAIFEPMAPAIKARDHDRFLDLNIQYHRALVGPSPNPVLRELVELTWNRSERYWRLLRVVPDHYMASSYRYHERLHEAVKTRDAVATEAVMRELLEFALEQILAHFPRHENKSRR
ncbi:MAG: GntR family transcriptional regulator [Gaiellaceae bacterium]